MGRSGVDAEYHYNLTPFKEIMRFVRYRDVIGTEAVLLNILGNVVAFMPYGFLVPKIIRRYKNVFHIVLYSFELSLMVETFQLIFKIGSFDVDDLMLNTVGGLLGYIVYFLFEKIRSKHNGIWKKKA